MTSSKESKLQRRPTRANALRLVSLSPLTSEAHSIQDQVLPRPPPPLPQPPPPAPPPPPLLSVLRVPLSAPLVRFRLPFLRLVQVTSMLLPLQSRPLLPLQSLPQSNDCELGDYIYVTPPFWGCIYFHRKVELQEIDILHRAPSGYASAFPLPSLSRVTLFLYPTFTEIHSPVFDSVLTSRFVRLSLRSR